MKADTLKTPHILYDAMYMISWKRQNYWAGKQISGYQGLGVSLSVELQRESIKKFYGAMELLDILVSNGYMSLFNCENYTPNKFYYMLNKKYLNRSFKKLNSN